MSKKQKTKEAIRAKIEQGYASAQGAELLDSDRVRQEMQQRKSAWLGAPPKAK